MRGVSGLNIFFCTKVNNTILNEFAIVFLENVLKQLQKKLDGEMSFSIL